MIVERLWFASHVERDWSYDEHNRKLYTRFTVGGGRGVGAELNQGHGIVNHLDASFQFSIYVYNEGNTISG